MVTGTASERTRTFHQVPVISFFFTTDAKGAHDDVKSLGTKSHERFLPVP